MILNLYSDVENYLVCQWTKSNGCPYLERITRNYLKTVVPIIETCNMTIPVEALYGEMTNKGKYHILCIIYLS